MKHIGAVIAFSVVLAGVIAAGAGAQGRHMPSVQAASEDFDAWGRFPAGSYAVVRTSVWERDGAVTRVNVNEARLVSTGSSANLPRVQTEVRALSPAMASWPNETLMSGGAGIEVLTAANQTLLCRWTQERSLDGQTVTRAWRSRKAPGELVRLVRVSNGGQQVSVSELVDFGTPERR